MPKIDPLVSAAHNVLRKAMVLPRSVMASLCVKVSFVAIQMLSTIVLARILSPQGFGQFSTVLAVAAVLGIFSSLGMPTLLVREVSRASRNNSGYSVRALWRWCRNMSVLISACVGSAALVVCFFFLDHQEWKAWTYILILLIPMSSILAMQNGYIRGLGHTIIGQLPQLIVLPTSFLVLVGISDRYVYRLDLDASVALILYLISIILSVLISKVIVSYVNRDVSELEPRRLDSRPLLISAVLLASLSGIQVLNHQSDLLILAWSETPLSVGLYKSASTAVMTVIFSHSAIFAIYSPRFAKMASSESLVELQKLVSQASRQVVVTTIPLGLLVFLFAKPLVSFLFGREYTGSASAIQILVVGQILFSVFAVGPVVFSMCHKEKYLLKVVAMVAVMNVALNLVLVGFFGMNGVAFGTSLSLVVYGLLMAVYAPRECGLSLRLW